jgi:hypothetical protein
MKNFIRLGIFSIVFAGIPAYSADIEPDFHGQPLSYWVQVLRDRDDRMDIAFAAIRQLGPGAAGALTELKRILNEPFTPIVVGSTRRDDLLAGLASIELRGKVVDAMGDIGDPASATALIKWALTPRIIAMGDLTDSQREIFIDLVGIDALERMRVVGVMAQFGSRADDVLTVMLQARDENARKLAVAILGERAMPVATDLLISRSCDDRQLGLALMGDMWSFIPRENIVAVESLTECGHFAQK